MELTFGEQIKIILKRKNMTIRQLAELIEVQTGKPMSRQNLTQKLNRDNFQEQDMREVAQALGCLVQISVIDPMEATVASLQAIMPAKPVSDETMVLSDETMVLPDDMTAFSDHTAAFSNGMVPVSDETMVLPEEPAAQTEKPAVQGRGRLVRGGRRTMAVPKPTVSPEPEAEKWLAKPAEEKPSESEERVETVAELPDAAAAAGTESFAAVARNESNLSGAEASEQAVEVNGDLLKEIEQALSQSVESELREESGAERAEENGYGSAEAEADRNHQEPQNDPLAWASRRPTVWPTLHIPEDPVQAEEEVVGGAENSEEPLDDLEFEPIEVEAESEAAPVNPEPSAELPEYTGESEYAEAETGGSESEYGTDESIPSEEPQAQPQEEIHPEQLVQLDPVFFELDELDGGDVSGVSAPYSVKREPEERADGSENAENEMENGDHGTEENEESGHAPINYHSMSSIPGGDVSYVSAPYVIEREEEPEEPAYNGYYEIPEDELTDITFDESEDRIPDFGETKEEPDLGKKLAEWDAAVQKTLEKPLFLTPEERRARKEAEEAEKAAAEAEAEKETAGLPTVDPATGQEYETNTVMHHPSKPDTLLVYDSDEHRWIEQNERAFNNFQIRKRALLGKDYEPPVYLD